MASNEVLATINLSIQDMLLFDYLGISRDDGVRPSHHRFGGSTFIATHQRGHVHNVLVIGHQTGQGGSVDCGLDGGAFILSAFGVLDIDPVLDRGLRITDGRTAPGKRDKVGALLGYGDLVRW